MAEVERDHKMSIIDIHQGGISSSTLDEMHAMLNPIKGQERRLPTILLYDERGLKLFEEITYLDEYYLTDAEIEVLTHHADEIASQICAGSMLVELGSGNLRKISILLQAFERAQKRVEYYALDLSKPELERTLAAVQGMFHYVQCYGLYGTYEDGLAWLKQINFINKPKCVLWMGSSIGNINRTEAAQFLKRISTILGSHGTMLVGIDACQDKDKVYHAYNDRKGTTHNFILNGLMNANGLAGKTIFNERDWKVIGEYDEQCGRHQAFLTPITNVTVEGLMIEAGERIRIEESYKYSVLQSNDLWRKAGLVPQARYSNKANEYHLHLISNPTFSFPLEAQEYARKPVPSLQEFEQLWKAWDVVTRQMIPEQELLSKPIKLRNCCLFYLGHIPTFLDIHLTQATGNGATNPSSYRRIFERGIDPDVDNPEHCHVHSEIPDEWPPLGGILDYQARVRDRARDLYKNNKPNEDRKLGRAMWIGFEHEVMHLETLLYMLLQSDQTRPPGMTPDFAVLSEQSRATAVPNQWFEVPESTLKVGMNDPDDNLGPDRFFGWDNEKPERSVRVPGFEAQARPLSNEDYALYLDQSGQHVLPASWTMIQDKVNDVKVGGTDINSTNSVYLNGHGPRLSNAYLKGKYIKTVYGPVPLSYALDWPVAASYNELSKCAKWMNGRIPTVEEARSIYNYVDINKNKHTDSITTKKISAVNGHLSNDGVEISPPSNHWREGASGANGVLDSEDLFRNLEGCNVGFQNFHPTPVTQDGGHLVGQGDFGGLWEWTSSVLERHEGFVPMSLYPAYTDDFFDGKHNIVLGGSWATHPRIAGRKSFVNWYQRNYLFAWCGARVVRDL